MKRLLTKILKTPFMLYIKMHEKEYQGLKYLKFNRKSRALAIVFSAFDSEDSRRAYNYVRSLSYIPIDFLFLSDPWGFRGSYYMLNNGSPEPQEVTLSIVNQRINRGGYSRVITLGTSKGGTSALFYGLKIGATDIITGACQYRIGSYVANYPDIFKGMTGNAINSSDIEMMNNIMPDVLRNRHSKSSKILLVHSMKEPTYERDIKYLIKDLNSNSLSWEEQECGFTNHDDVAKYFIPIAKDRLNKINQETK